MIAPSGWSGPRVKILSSLERMSVVPKLSAGVHSEMHGYIVVAAPVASVLNAGSAYIRGRLGWQLCVTAQSP